MRTYISKFNIKNNLEINKTICHISDIHFFNNYNIKRFEIIKEQIKKINPDFICITGDLVDNNIIVENDYIKHLYNFFSDLGLIAKVLITLGNHDLETYKDKKRVYKYPYKFVRNIRKLENVTLLENEKKVFDNICFIGYNPTYEYYEKFEFDFDLLKNNFNLEKFKLNKNNYNILLLHTPIGIMAFENNIVDNFNLILCGHTHGGMIPSSFFGNRGLYSPNKLILPHDMRGHKKIRQTDIIICSGIYKLPKTSKLDKLNDLYAMDINEIMIKPLQNK
ncbi:MAG: metallophosphoesterase [Mycoplasmatota bacterium]